MQDRLYRRAPHGLQPINRISSFATDFDTVYREANTCFALKNSNVKTGSTMGPQVVHFPVSKDEFFFINSEQTLKIADILLNGDNK
nr:hypothetical protein [Desulfobulbaceae bacterium]